MTKIVNTHIYFDFSQQETHKTLKHCQVFPAGRSTSQNPLLFGVQENLIFILIGYTVKEIVTELFYLSGNAPTKNPGLTTQG